MREMRVSVTQSNMKRLIMTPFAQALTESGLKPRQLCRAIERLTGRPFSPTMPSRWISGLHDAPPLALAVVALLARLPEEERAELIAAPPRKAYTRKEIVVNSIRHDYQMGLHQLYDGAGIGNEGE